MYIISVSLSINLIPCSTPSGVVWLGLGTKNEIAFEACCKKQQRKCSRAYRDFLSVAKCRDYSMRLSKPPCGWGWGEYYAGCQKTQRTTIIAYIRLKGTPDFWKPSSLHRSTLYPFYRDSSFLETPIGFRAALLVVERHVGAEIEDAPAKARCLGFRV